MLGQKSLSPTGLRLSKAHSFSQHTALTVLFNLVGLFFHLPKKAAGNLSIKDDWCDTMTDEGASPY
jgi:hypothetical protein